MLLKTPPMARIALIVLSALCLGTSWAGERPADAPNLRLTELGEYLFSDERLSSDRQTSCASCHRVGLAFSDSRPVSTGASRRPATRNAPTLLNLGHSSVLFWDGRRGSLDELMIEPLTNPSEHGFRSDQELVAALRADRELTQVLARFWVVVPEKIDSSHVTRPLAAYVASLVSTSSAFDRYFAGGHSAISPAAERGYAIGFDPNVFEVLGVTEGTFLRQGGAETTFTPRIDKTTGQVFVTNKRTGPNAGLGATAVGTTVVLSLKATASQAPTTLQLVTFSAQGAQGSGVGLSLPPPLSISVSP